MLEKLDKINWAELQHAYGSAEDVLGLLRDLASPNADTREEAMYELYGNIWHQGTVYQATAYAVPFLLELLQADSPADKASVLMLLHDLANGSSYIDVHQDLHIFQGAYQAEMQTSEWQAQLAQELEYARLAREAVLVGIPIYMVLLNNDDSAKRMLSAHLLGNLSRSHASLQQPLRERLTHEHDPQVQATILLALANPKQPEQATLEALQHGLTLGDERLVHWSAAVALASHLGKQTPLTARRLLLEVAREPKQLIEQYERLPWIQDDFLDVCANACLELDEQHQSEVVQALCSCMAGAELSSLYQLLELLLELTFGPIPDHAHNDANKAWHADDLSPLQRQALQAIIDNDAVWDNSNNLLRELGHYHLPSNRQSLRDLLG